MIVKPVSRQVLKRIRYALEEKEIRNKLYLHDLLQRNPQLYSKIQLDPLPIPARDPLLTDLLITLARYVS